MPILKVSMWHDGLKPDVYSESIKSQNSIISEIQSFFSSPVPPSWLFKLRSATSMYKNCLLVIMRGFLHGLWTTEPRGHVPGANTDIWTQELTPLAPLSFTFPPPPSPLPLNLCLLLLVLSFLPSNGTNNHNCSLRPGHFCLQRLDHLT